MKKIFALFAVVLVSTVAFATEPGDGSKTTGLAVVQKSESTFNLFYQPAGVTDVRVYIRDAQGKEVFSESVKNTDGFIRPYTFSQLEHGEYSVTVIDGKEKYSQKLIYAKPNAKRLATVIQLADGRYFVAIPASAYSGAAQIRIYDGNELAHKQTIQASGFAKLFNVKNLSNTPTVEVVDSNGNKIN